MPILLYSYSWFIYNFVILFLLFLVCVNKKIKKSSYFIIFVFFIIFSVYGYITADFNSYLEYMHPKNPKILYGLPEENQGSLCKI